MVDEQRLNTFLGKGVSDLGAAVSAVLVSIGDELGLHDQSIETARQQAKDAGLANARFQAAE